MSSAIARSGSRQASGCLRSSASRRGCAGHITARDPIEPDTFWVNPFRVPFAHVSVSSLIRVSHSGEVVEGAYHVNEAAFAIHSQVHAARPDVMAAAHSHSTLGRALSTLGTTLEPITQDVSKQ